MRSFSSLSFEELGGWLAEQGEPGFRAKQIFEWVYQKGVASFEEMTNLGKGLREALAGAFVLDGLKLIKVTDAQDGETTKFLWRLSDGKLVESVLICSGDRRTVCVSSQVGCPAKCAFCASGKRGFFRNLDEGEIVEQVLQIGREHRVTHVVFMGMGEPLRNLDAVLGSIRRLNDPQMFGISQRRITVSTVGVIEGIERMSQEGLKVNLVLSLHAPNQHIRKKIIPYAREYEYDDLLVAMDGYSKATGRDITYEYTLMEGINDQPEHARELVSVLRQKQCTVNLIPYNPVEGLKLKRPERRVIEAFQAILNKAKIVNTCRYTKGDDIAAACGQLALQVSLDS